MNTTAKPGYKTFKRVKDSKFDIDNLHHYTLSLQAGIYDFQICVTDGRSSDIVYFEDIRLENVKTVKSRLVVLQQLFDSHHFLKAGFWADVKLAIKSHKFSLVPADHFLPTSASDYLVVNCEVRPNMEEVLYYKHIATEAVNVFAADHKLVVWIKSLYPSKKVSIVHQGSALIEGILKYDDHNHEKTMFCNVDRGILHIVVTQDRSLLYYNQFAARKSEDFLKYIMTVFKEVGLSPKRNKVLMWGSLRQQSKHMELLRRYIRNISYASKPHYLNFSHAFDELPEYNYFDAYSIFLCE
ncbi:MAG: DUF3822 family protein [Bacteroidota bacterium]